MHAETLGTQPGVINCYCFCYCNYEGSVPANQMISCNTVCVPAWLPCIQRRMSSACALTVHVCGMCLYLADRCSAVLQHYWMQSNCIDCCLLRQPGARSALQHPSCQTKHSCHWADHELLISLLTQLSLSFCRSDDITPRECLRGCSSLTSVKLSGNYYSSVPAFLSTATNLQCLHIANNSISSGSTTCLAALTALSKLVMQQCALDTLPDSLAALSNLQWLCLSRNNLHSIPDGLPWGKLTLLHLRGNELGAVPCSALAGATQLQVVDCGDNFPLQVRLLAAAVHCICGKDMHSVMS